ncbi:hypothetical protein [Beduini sp.]|uniref:hypothetical protein n=2 Tax=Beduini sp. TaxID=1922300 RepID=UPI00399085B6
MFILNLSLFAYAQQQNEIPLTAYKALQTKLLSLPNEERYLYICDYDDIIQDHFILQQMLYLEGRQDSDSLNKLEILHAQYPDIEKKTSRDFLETAIYYTKNLEQESQFMQAIRKEMEQLHGYHDRLSAIQDKADHISSISIFSDPASFSSKNIKKTAEDFKNMQDVVITYQLDKGIKEALHFPFTDVLVILMIGVIATALILEEKEKRLFCFVRPCINGGTKTMAIKCLVMGISIACVILLLYASNLIYMQTSCGLGSLQASLQSLGKYAQSTLHLSIGGYLVLFIGTKWIAACIIGALMILIALFSKQRIFCFGAMLLVMGIEFLLYQYLPNHQSISVLRYINFISFLRTDVFYEMYYNLNIFQHAYSLQKLAQIIMITLFILLLAAICIIYTKKQNLYSQHTDFLSRKKKQKLLPYLWVQELYKIFFVQKGLIIILIFMGIQGYSLQHNSIYESIEESRYRHYIEIMKGKPSEATDQFISSQQQHYEDLHMQYDKNEQSFNEGQINKTQYDYMQNALETQLFNESLFQKAVWQYEYVKEDPQREMVVPFGYERLFFNDEVNLLPAILSIVCLTLLFSNLLCTEYTHRADRLLLACKKGDKILLHCKLRIALICGLLVTLLAYLPGIVHIFNKYGTLGIHASITSLSVFVALPSAMSIMIYLILNFLLKLAAIECTVFLLFFLSKWLRHQSQVIFLLLMMTAVPLLLHRMDITFLDAFSLYPLLCSSSTLIKNGQGLLVCFSIIGYSLLVIFCYITSLSHYKLAKQNSRISRLYLKYTKK